MKFGILLVLITSDLGIVAGACARAVLKYCGQARGEAPATERVKSSRVPTRPGILVHGWPVRFGGAVATRARRQMRSHKRRTTTMNRKLLVRPALLGVLTPVITGCGGSGGGSGGSGDPIVVGTTDSIVQTKD